MRGFFVCDGQNNTVLMTLLMNVKESTYKKVENAVKNAEETNPELPKRWNEDVKNWIKEA